MAASVTPGVQGRILYQAAFPFSLQQHEKAEEWPMAECWN